MAIQKIISDLYDSTLTRAKKMDFFTPAYEDSVEALLTCNFRSTRFHEFSDDEIKQFIIFVLCLVDAPVNMRGMLKGESCIRHLVSIFLDRAVEDKTLRQQFLSLLDRWFFYLRRSVPSDLVALTKSPLIKDSPLLAFHIAAYAKSIDAHPNYPFYRAYGHKFHLIIRDLSRKNPRESYYQSSVRAARYFFIFVPSDVLALPKHPENMPRKYITGFLQKLKEKLQSEDLDTLLQFYERIFIQLLKRTPVRKRNKGRSGKRKKASGDTTLGNIAGEITGVTFKPETEEDIEFISKYDFLQTNADEVVIAKKPYLNRVWTDALNGRNHHFWWDKQSLMLDDLHAIYAACTRHWGKSDQYDRIIIFLLLLVHFGLDTNKLLRLSCTDTTVPRIHIEKGHLYLVVQSPIKPLLESHWTQNCHASSSPVYLIVPSKLALLIRTKLTSNADLFQYRSGDGSLKNLDAQHINEFVKRFINKNSGHEITFSRIESSFSALYLKRYGLDPINACYVSSSVVFGLYQAQLHYINVDAWRLTRDHVRVFELLDSAIVNNAYTSKDREELRMQCQENFDLFFGHDDSTIPVVLPVKSYGSDKVPMFDAMHDVITRLKSAISASKRIVERHNLYVSYAYLCLEFAGGMRPKKPDQNSISFLEDDRAIVVRDKNSPMFIEERLLWLPEIAFAILTKLDKGFLKLRTELASSMNSLFINMERQHPFFLLDDSGNSYEFDMAGLRRCLAAAGIEYIFPDNGPRHYVKSRFHKEGINIEVSDAWCGHSRNGLESLNLASSIIPANNFLRCRDVIEAILIELGFADIPYLL